MTQPIETMTPAELSAAVAREVMGWEFSPKGDYLSQDCWESSGGIVCPVTDFAPATSVRDAFTIRDIMRVQGFSFVLRDNPGGGVSCVFDKLPDPIRARAIEMTDALAITRAALAAVRALQAGMEGG